jgi:hypothetical protein
MTPSQIFEMTFFFYWRRIKFLRLPGAECNVLSNMLVMDEDLRSSTYGIELYEAGFWRETGASGKETVLCRIMRVKCK